MSVSFLLLSLTATAVVGESPYSHLGNGLGLYYGYTETHNQDYAPALAAFRHDPAAVQSHYYSYHEVPHSQPPHKYSYDPTAAVGPHNERTHSSIPRARSLGIPSYRLYVPVAYRHVGVYAP